MKFALTDQESGYFIQAYREQQIIIDDLTYANSLVVLPNQLIPDWPVHRASDLAEAHFSALLETKPDLVLLGTGDTQHFPPPKLYRSLISAGIGVEVMATSAACRTYNILAGEGRRVAAAERLRTGRQDPRPHRVWPHRPARRHDRERLGNVRCGVRPLPGRCAL